MDFQIPDFGLGKSCFPDRKVRNLKSTVFLCVQFFGKKLGVWNFSLTMEDLDKFFFLNGNTDFLFNLVDPVRGPKSGFR